MQRFVRQSVAVIAATMLLSTLALLIAQGRIFSQLSANPFAKVIGDGFFVFSLPGVMVAVAVWGYNSSRTTMSDVIIVLVNGVLYALPIVVVLFLLSRRQKRAAIRRSGA